MAAEAQNLSREMAHAYLTGTIRPQKHARSLPARGGLYASSATGIRNTQYDIRNTRQNMQNKPNLLNAQMNVSSFITKDYENIHPLGRHKNKANSNPIKPNLRNDKMNVSLYITKGYENKSLRRRSQNKPNQTQFKPNFQNDKMTVTLYSTKDYENKPLRRRSQNKPNSNPIPQRDTQYAIRDTRYKPNQTQPVVSLSNLFQTQYAIPNTQYEIRDTCIMHR